MLRIVFTMLLILHGFLHLIGFAKEWGITSHRLSKRLLVLTNNPSRVAGTLWLVACAFFIAAGLFYLLRREWYWVSAAVGLIISQILILIYWNDARYGTIVNVIILMAVIVSAAAMRFNHTVRDEVQMMLSKSKPTKRIITEDMIAPLPQSVQAWIRQSGAIGKSMPDRIRVRQKGTLRTRPDGRWMPFYATQYFSLDPPAFVWIAEIQAASIVHIAGRDKFMDGKGHMLIKPLYLFEAANSAGPEIDQGALLRYLAEMSWFPQAAVSEYLTWESISESQARVTMRYGNVSASGIYFFNEKKQVTAFEAHRYGEFDGVFRKEIWSIDVKRHRTLGGVSVGAVNEVTWKLKDGDFTWLKLELTGIQPLD